MKQRPHTIRSLIELVTGAPRVFIQTHNFPDHDAVASAFGLQQLLASFDIQSRLVYDFEIQRDSLKQMVADLAIDLKPVVDHDIVAEDVILLVDGCKGNKNVTDLPGREIAVIDHHLSRKPNDVPFADIRHSYGACASIIACYYSDLALDMPRDVATALMIGISLDTFFLSRGVTTEDLTAYYNCFARADTEYVSAVLRNNIQLDDLTYYRYLLNHLQVVNRWAFCHFESGCSQNLLGILANFVLAIDSIDFVVLCATNGEQVSFSVRNEVPHWDAAEITAKLLAGIGFGGGHAEMAGGIIVDRRKFESNTFIERVAALLDKRGIC